MPKSLSSFAIFSESAIPNAFDVVRCFAEWLMPTNSELVSKGLNVCLG